MLLQEFFVKLGLDVDAQSFARGALAVETLKLGLSAVVTVAEKVTHSLAHAVTSVVETADKIDELAQSTGISTDALQELAYAGSFSGFSLESMAHAMVLLSRNMRAALDGSKDTAAAFAKLGVKVNDGKGHIRNADEVLEDLAEKFAALPTSSEKSTLALKLFGRTGDKLIPFLNEGREGVARLRQEAHDLGVVLDEDTIKNGVRAADEMDRFKAALTGVKNAIVVPLLPALTAAAKAITGWVKAHREAIRARMAEFVRVLGIAFGLLGRGISFVLKGWNLLIDHAKDLVAALGRVIITLYAGGDAMHKAGAAAVAAAAVFGAAWALAALPLLGVFLILEDIYTALTGGESVTGKAIAALTEWLSPDGKAPGWVKAIITFFRDDLPAAIKATFDLIMEDIRAAKDLITGRNTGLVSGERQAQAAAAARGDFLAAAAFGRAADTRSRVEDAQSLGNPLNPFSHAGDTLTGIADTLIGRGATLVSPELAGQIAGGFQQDNKINVEVNVPAGTDAQGVGDAVKRSISDALADQYRKAGLGVAGGGF